MKEFWTSVASLLGVFAFFQSLLHAVFPPDLRFATAKLVCRFFGYFSSYCYFDITEIDGVNTNELYNAVQLYLSSSASVSGSRLSLTRALNSSAFTFGLSNNDHLVDTFDGAAVTWEHVVTQWQPQSFSWRPLPQEKRGFVLRIRKKDKHVVLHSYLDHIMDKANDIRRQNQDRLLYTNSRGGALDARGHPWDSVPFKHPSTFETLAMDPERKEEIMADLRDFADGKTFYQKTGRAWKRGYLLHGPPGTGKSSMIAAMANYLGYDIYDLELTEVHTNAELRKLLMKTTPKSIIVIEDIDCSIDLTNRKTSGSNNKLPVLLPTSSDPPFSEAAGGMSGSEESAKSLTLSGLLNFTDGLWSCCGSERIFVFTTNHVEKLDPALVRSGRMDMHIFMSYCSFPALKILMKNYLDFDPAEGEDARSMRELEEAMGAAQMTPADVSEVLIKSRRKEKGEVMAELLEALRRRAEATTTTLTAGGLLTRDGRNDEAEEQEKRALGSPKEGSDSEAAEDCNGEDKRRPLRLR